MCLPISTQKCFPPWVDFVAPDTCMLTRFPNFSKPCGARHSRGISCTT